MTLAFKDKFFSSTNLIIFCHNKALIDYFNLILHCRKFWKSKDEEEGGPEVKTMHILISNGAFRAQATMIYTDYRGVNSALTTLPLEPLRGGKASQHPKAVTRWGGQLHISKLSLAGDGSSTSRRYHKRGRTAPYSQAILEGGTSSHPQAVTRGGG